jgi:hypothetical protein
MPLSRTATIGYPDLPLSAASDQAYQHEDTRNNGKGDGDEHQDPQ